MSELVLCSYEKGVSVITINNAANYNAADEALFQALYERVNACINDENTRVIIITGAGKAFCAGGDLRRIYEADEPAEAVMEKMVDALCRVIRAIRGSGKPFIAAVNGVAAGAGLSIAMACDIRVASDQAKFRQAYTTSGLTPDGGWTLFVPALAGPARAMEMTLLDPVLDAEKAHVWGLVNQLCAPERLMETAREWAQKIAAGSATALAAAKKMINENVYKGLEQALQAEKEEMVAAAAGYDGKEGIKAFIEKRPPSFG